MCYIGGVPRTPFSREKRHGRSAGPEPAAASLHRHRGRIPRRQHQPVRPEAGGGRRALRGDVLRGPRPAPQPPRAHPRHRVGPVPVRHRPAGGAGFFRLLPQARAPLQHDGPGDPRARGRGGVRGRPPPRAARGGGGGPLLRCADQHAGAGGGGGDDAQPLGGPHRGDARPLPRRAGDRLRPDLPLRGVRRHPRLRPLQQGFQTRPERTGDGGRGRIRPGTDLQPDLPDHQPRPGGPEGGGGVRGAEGPRIRAQPDPQGGPGRRRALRDRPRSGRSRGGRRGGAGDGGRF